MLHESVCYLFHDEHTTKMTWKQFRYSLHCRPLPFTAWLTLWMFFISGILVLSLKPSDTYVSDGVQTYRVTKRDLPSRLRRLLLHLLLTKSLSGSSEGVPSSFFQPYYELASHHLNREISFNAYMGQLQDHGQPRIMDFDADRVDIALDNCASLSLTGELSDLIDPRPIPPKLCKGVGSGMVTHMGTWKLQVTDDQGRKLILEDREVGFLPGLDSRVFSVSNWVTQRNALRNDTLHDGIITTAGGETWFKWNRLANRFRNTMTLHHRSKGIPVTRAKILGTSDHEAYLSCFSIPILEFNDDDEAKEETEYTPKFIPRRQKRDPPPTNDENVPNASRPQTDFSTPSVPTTIPKTTCSDEDLLMHYHLRFGHLPFGRLKQAARQGLIPRRLSNCETPKCAGCLFGKLKRQAWRSRLQPGKIGGKVDKPGDIVSVDQLESKTPGLIPQIKGILQKKRFTVATIFVDHFSGFTYVHPQASTSAEDTVQAKLSFERYASRFGVTIRHYHADNGAFATKLFRQAVADAQQTQTFCGVNAHHQNGVAEKKISSLTELTRSMLLHAKHHNPFVNDSLWPFALCHAADIDNSFPTTANTQSPVEKFSGVFARPKLKHFQPWGCPAYVLTNSLQTNSKQPKWEERSRIGVYLGQSKEHATSVSLILHPRTGHVSPQFHCVFDPTFETIKNLGNFAKFWPTSPAETFPTSKLKDYSNTSTKNLLWIYDDDDDKTDTTVVTSNTSNQGDQFPSIPPEPEEPEDHSAPDFFEPETPESAPQFVTPSEDVPTHVPEVRPPPLPGEYTGPQTRSRTLKENEGAQPPAENEGAPTTTRSGRTIKPNPKYSDSPVQAKLSLLYAYTAITGMLSDSTYNVMHPFAFVSSLADKDTMTFSEMLKQDDRDSFLQAMEKEVQDHVDRKHWRIATREEKARLGNTGRVIMAVWSFKRKRNPFGVVTKYKARLCAHGGQTQQGIHYEESYSPVVSWTTVRLLLTLSQIHGWHTRQIDFVLAFPQAQTNTDLYMEVPQHFEVKNGELLRNANAPKPRDQPHILKLLKNLYGLKDAGFTWFEHLKKGLRARGFRQSICEPCLFIKDNLILLTYVDDCIAFCAEKKPIDDFIESMKKDYDLTDEGDIGAYLGIQISKHGNEYHLTQPALIKRICETVPLKDQRLHNTPADRILTREGEPRKSNFHYRSAVGQLNYLTGTTRPDLMVATHQCARFSADPRLQHEQAVKRIVRYLKRTSDKGLILKPDTSRGLECNVDADFAGGFNKLTSDDPSTCYSRTGYIVWYAGCPIIWQSKMQTTIALSTTEAEYIALSTALRDVIFVMNLLRELVSFGVTLIKATPKIKCKVFEDNVGALELAKTPKMRPRTKHIAIQYHHFRKEVEDGNITIQHVRSEEQVADIATKPLPFQLFSHLRYKLMGW